MKRLAHSLRLFCHRQALCFLAFLNVLAIGLLLTGCLSPLAPAPPPPGADSLRRFLSEEYLDPNPSYVAESTGDTMVRLWTNGTDVPPEKIQERWDEAQRRLEEFKVCTIDAGLGTIAIANISSPTQATATICHNWEYEVQCQELRLATDGDQWNVLSETTLAWVHCDPGPAP